jgi:hypothetical protein
MEPEGDPGILLARIHQDELLRRNGGGIAGSPRRRSDVALPFEHLTGALAVALLVLLLFLD